MEFIFLLTALFLIAQVLKLFIKSEGFRGLVFVLICTLLLCVVSGIYFGKASNIDDEEFSLAIVFLVFAGVFLFFVMYGLRNVCRDYVQNVKTASIYYVREKKGYSPTAFDVQEALKEYKESFSNVGMSEKLFKEGLEASAKNF